MSEKSYITDCAHHFPSLALAYVQGQDLRGRSPEEVLAMYDDALTRIWDAFNKKQNN